MPRTVSLQTAAGGAAGRVSALPLLLAQRSEGAARAECKRRQWGGSSCEVNGVRGSARTCVAGMDAACLASDDTHQSSCSSLWPACFAPPQRCVDKRRARVFRGGGGRDIGSASGGARGQAQVGRNGSTPGMELFGLGGGGHVRHAAYACAGGAAHRQGFRHHFPCMHAAAVPAINGYARPRGRQCPMPRAAAGRAGR